LAGGEDEQVSDWEEDWPNTPPHPDDYPNDWYRNAASFFIF